MINLDIHIRRWQLASGVALLLVIALIAVSLAMNTDPTPRAPSRLAWSSDFSGPAGTVPAGWHFDTGGTGWGNYEQQYYVTSAQDKTTQNAVLDGHGDLAITVRRNTDPALKCAYDAAGTYYPAGITCLYTSAKVDTSTIPAANRRYGRIEARIKLPAGVGIWPAFWALGTDCPLFGWPECGEIDVFEEIGSRPGTVAGHLHGPETNPSVAWQEPPSFFASPYTLPGGQAFSSGFHTFAVDWYPDHVSFSVDGHVYATVERASLPKGDAWVFDKPFYLILNVAVGGKNSLGGAPDSATTLPQTMLVKWVRVYY